MGPVGTAVSRPGAQRRVLVVDFAGHPFQAELSRAIAQRDHTVLHVYAGHVGGPKGRIERSLHDSPALQFKSIGSGRQDKASLLSRFRIGVNFGLALRREIGRFRPDSILVANVPPEALVCAGFGSPGMRWVWWVQDLFGPASSRILGRRSRILGRAAAVGYGGLEKWVARRADAIVVIAEDFLRYLPAQARDKVTVIHNWAPLDELPVRARENPWATSQDLAGGFNFLYAGTLALKHNPKLLVELAEALRETPGARVVVVSEGPGADAVRVMAAERSLHNLRVLGFQAYDLLPDVLASGDVLIALLETDAGVFSVPSKVLSYLCAMRPILASIPQGNLASELLRHSNAGIAVDASDGVAFVRAALVIMGDPPLAARYGAAGRAFAERHFHIQGIADRFLGVLVPREPEGR